MRRGLLHGGDAALHILKLCISLSYILSVISLQY